MKIFLIGFMGAGKSTLGKRLAEMMNYVFIDLDYYIEKKEGLTIPEIFDQKGEAYFRHLEHEMLLEITGMKENLVVSTGGGAPCHMNNMELLKSSGITVYLKLDPDKIYHRLINARKKNRPLIHTKSPRELMQFIIDKLKERETVYSQSHLTVPGDTVKIQYIQKWIVSNISNFIS